MARSVSLIRLLGNIGFVVTGCAETSSHGHSTKELVYPPGYSHLNISRPNTSTTSNGQALPITTAPNEPGEPASSALVPTYCGTNNGNVTAHGIFQGMGAPDSYGQTAAEIALSVYSAPSVGAPDGTQLTMLRGGDAARLPRTNGTSRGVTGSINPEGGIPARCEVSARATRQ